MSAPPVSNSKDDDSSAPVVPQFTTRTLFVLTAAIAASLLPWLHWGNFGMPASVLLVIFTLLVWRKNNGWIAGIVSAILLACFLLLLLLPPKTREVNEVGVLFLVLTFSIGPLLLLKRVGTFPIVVFLFAMLLMCLPDIRNHNPSARSAQCQIKMKQIGLALHLYQSIHGHFPPPYSTDKDGNPLHSWRVLILPYLEETKLYDQIDLTKPWHHPKNLAFAKSMPWVYRCPEHRRQPDEVDVTTAHVAIVGDHTAWPRNGIRTIKEIVDGTSQTLMVAESEKHRIHWMSTADPGIETLGPTEGDGETLLAQRPHGNAFYCVLCDGSFRYLDSDYSFEDFLSLLTIDGGERHKLPE